MLLASVLMMIASPAWAETTDVAAYLRARVASADGHAARAATDYAAVLAASPDDPVVAIRAYRAGLAAGDDALALRAALVLDKAGVAPADTALIPLAMAAKTGDAATAEAASARMKGTALALIVPALAEWMAFARGAPLPATSATDPAARRFATEVHALALIAGGHGDDGMAAVGALGGRDAPLDLRAAAARLLIGAGRTDKTRDLLSPGEMSLAVAAKPTLGFGISWLLTRVAGELVAAQPSPLSIALTRAALTADPGNDRARLLLALALAAQEAPQSALQVLDRVAADSPYAGSALTARIVILNDSKQSDDAIAVAKSIAERSGSDPEDWQRYADLLVQAGRDAAARPWLQRVAMRDGASWADWLQYGGALDRDGDWRAAEPALEKAVALGPDQPVALNYLGYARIEHNAHVADATRMLLRAHLLKPDDASIADSLGWAYFHAGDAARALPLVEGAAARQPANAEIGEHLGDIYWSLGRRYEARYAWRAAAVTASPADATRLAAKIAG